MAEGIFVQPRVSPPDANSCKQFAQTTKFGTAGISVAATPGRLYGVTVVNTAATAYFVQIHDKATAAVATNVPIWEDVLPASSAVTISFGAMGLYYANGLSLALSSTGGVLTLAVSADATAYALHANA